MSKVRGFEEVTEAHIQNINKFTDEKGKTHSFPNKDTKLPCRSDSGSAGYDFFIKKDVKFLPKHFTKIFTDVKAYMPESEVLLLFIRSSLAGKGLSLSTKVSVIDSSYYGSEENDGNIIINVYNDSGTTVELKAGDRIAQGVFVDYKTIDNDEPTSKTRTGGIGSSGA